MNSDDDVHSSRLKKIKLKVQGRIIDDIDISVAEQVRSLLPQCEHCFTVREFIKRHSQYDFGLVSHALTAELKAVLKEFDLLIAQFETMYLEYKLTMQKLLFLLQPSTVIMQSLADLCDKLVFVRGGEMLNVMYTALTEQVDTGTKQIYTGLFSKAMIPFINILEKWLFK